jgi:hypothetical protein
MLKTSAILALLFPAVTLAATAAAAVPGAAPDAAPSPYEVRAPLASDNPIDRLVFPRLEKLGIPPANLCSDAVFLRRAHLDVIGTLPTEQEARDFLADKSPDKRTALIDRLLKRDEFADYWAMKWSDLLRVKAEFPINLWPNGAQAYHRWIRTSIKENKPYDRFVREMLTASGSNFRTPAVNFYRAMQSRQPEAIARTVALTFMGMRAENWPKDRLDGMAAFFRQVAYKSTAEWKEEIVFDDPTKGIPAAGAAAATTATTQAAPTFPDGTPAKLSAARDPREVFADWLADPKNPWFARCVANRIWAWLLGRGVIHEPDDIRPDNPPSNPELLAFLEREVVAGQFDLKRLYRLILTSKAYQLSAIPRSDRPEAAVNFASYPLRRLDAEVLADAINQITGTGEKYTSPIPEPFTFIPESLRSIALPDGSITSSFLELFGRSARDTGLAGERNNRPTAAQRLHMLNSSHVQQKIAQGPKLQALLQSRPTPRETATSLYLAILSRYPTDEELTAATGYTPPGMFKGREAAIDLAWALMNSAEFLYRH